MERVRVPFREIINPPRGRVIRVGLLPYTVINGKTYYLFGKAGRGYLTDIGGGCKSSEKPLNCLLREIDEEIDNTTGRIIKSLLRNKQWKKEVWRETGPNFQSLGYPKEWDLRRTRKEPIHRFYIFLNLDDPDMLLGGPTGKDEVNEFIWFSQEQLDEVKVEDINSSVVDFYHFADVL